MLTFMRRNAGSWMIKVLLLGVALSFLVGFGTSYVFRSMAKARSGGMSEDVVAKVGDIAISRNEFMEQLDQMRRSYTQMGLSQNSEIFNSPLFLRGVLASLEDGTVLSLTAQEMKIGVSDSEVADYIRREGNFTEQGRFNRQRLMNYLHRLGMTLEEFENSIRFKVGGSKLANLLQDSVFVPEPELWQAYLKENEKIRIDYIKLGAETAVFNPQSLTDADLKAEYDAKTDAYKIPEKRKLNYIALSLVKFMEKANVSTDEMDKYYDEHQNEYRTDEQVRLSEIVFPVKDKAKAAAVKAEAEKVREQAAAADADFAALAKKFSQDPKTAEQGGDLGWKTKNAGPKAVMERAFEMKVGEVSNVLETPSGYTIVKLADRRAAGYKPMDEVREQIKLTLQSKIARDEINKEAARIYAELTPQTDLRAYAEKNGLEAMSTPFFTKDEPVPGIENGNKLVQTAFAMAPQEIAKPFDGTAHEYIVQLTEVSQAKTPTFEEAKETVRANLAAQKREALLKQKADAILADLRGGKLTMAKAAEEARTEVVDTGDFTAESYSVPKAGMVKGLVEAAFGVPEGQEYPAESVAAPDGRIVFRVAARTVPDKAQFEATKDQYRRKVQKEKGDWFLKQWMEARRAQYPTVENQEFWSKMVNRSESN